MDMTQTTAPKSDQERWLPVVGYERDYEVSDLGRVRSLDRKAHNGKHLQSQVICAYRMPSGHLRVALCRGGTRKTLKVHRLVLTAFVGLAPEGMETLHSDGNPANNAISNLAWGTKSQNARDQVEHGVHHESRKTHCPQGHEYNASNTYLWPKTNHRGCRLCIGSRYSANPEKFRERTRIYRAKKKAQAN